MAHRPLISTLEPDTHYQALPSVDPIHPINFTTLADSSPKSLIQHHQLHSYTTKLSINHSQFTMDSASTPAPDSSEQSIRQHLRHLDRESAVALAIILILIVSAIVYYIRSHLKIKRQMDLERQLEFERRGSMGGSMSGATWYRGGSSHSSGSSRSTGDRSSIFKITSLPSRVESVPSTLGSAVISTGERPQKRFRWPAFLKPGNPAAIPRSTTAWPQASIMPPHPLDHCPYHQHGSNNTQHRASRSLSPHSRSNSLFHSNHSDHTHALDSSPPAVRSSQRDHPSPTQARRDRTWWREVARHGSTTAASKRLSLLETIPEPGVAHEYEAPRARSRSFAAGRDGRGNLSMGLEARLYDWTRPGPASAAVASSGGGVQGWRADGIGDGDGDRSFGHVVWGAEKEHEGVQSTDWASAS